MLTIASTVLFSACKEPEIKHPAKTYTEGYFLIQFNNPDDANYVPAGKSGKDPYMILAYNGFTASIFDELVNGNGLFPLENGYFIQKYTQLWDGESFVSKIAWKELSKLKSDSLAFGDRYVCTWWGGGIVFEGLVTDSILHELGVDGSRPQYRQHIIIDESLVSSNTFASCTTINKEKLDDFIAQTFGYRPTQKTLPTDSDFFSAKNILQDDDSIVVITDSISTIKMDVFTIRNHYFEALNTLIASGEIKDYIVGYRKF